MAKYHIFSISANVWPTPSTTKADYTAEVILKTGTGDEEATENKRVGHAATLEEAMIIAQNECDRLNDVLLQYAKAVLAKFEDA